MTTGTTSARPVRTRRVTVARVPAPGRDAAGTLAFLRARAVAGLEEVAGVAGETYRRPLPLPGGPAVVDITPVDDAVALVVHGTADLRGVVRAVCRLLDLAHVEVNDAGKDTANDTVNDAGKDTVNDAVNGSVNARAKVKIAENEFDSVNANDNDNANLSDNDGDDDRVNDRDGERERDSDSDPGVVDAALMRDPALRAAVRQVPGIRVPGAVDGTELAVRAIVGQQISVAGARTILGRLVAAYGRPLAAPVGAVTHAFPTADRLATVDPADLPMPRRRGATLVEVCRRLASGELTLDPATPADAAGRAGVRAALLSVPGIGPWTADYLLMRVLHEPDAFLPTDLGVRAGLARAGLPTDPRAAARHAERWWPWRSYATLHLWRLASGAPQTTAAAP